MNHRIVTSFVCSETEPVVQTKAGKLRGYKMNEMYVFHGIRYATAERFKQPKPVEPWEGVVDAQDYGLQAPQSPPRIPMDPNLAFPKRYWPQGEDCLTLNVWSKQLDPAAKKPVMIWLHGGGFSSGSYLELEAYDGENMARYGDVVSVSVNHRLNILGYIDLSDYGPEYELSGIAGMEDIVAALRWVHENIAQFGGDPANVTIFGESGGGGKVNTLLQMGSADGLYQHAIIESGIMGGRGGEITPQQQKDAARELAHKVVDAAGGLEALCTMPYHEILGVLNKVQAGPFGFSPVPCTGSYIGDWWNAGFRPESLSIPVIAGSVFQELVPRPKSICDKNALTEEQRYAAMVETYGAEHAAEVRDAFKEAYPELNLYYCTLIDSMVRVPTALYTVKRSAAGGKTWNFMFAFETWYRGGLLSTHADELAFIFHNTEYIGAMYAGESTAKMQDLIFYAWINFARNGDPNYEGLPAWKPVTPTEHNCFVFDSDSSCRAGHDEKLMELVSKYRPMNFFGPRRPKKD